ncbi:MAG: LCP family protein [Oscillospiraceae bacterium]|nr:LCP family protein [Oscillospiraceae bacterium]
MFFVKKRKKESVAIPFLISMLVALVFIGIPASKVYQSLIHTKNENESKNNLEEYAPNSKNNTTVLVVFDVDDDELRDTFMVFRTYATNRRFVSVPISNELLYNTDLSSTRMDDIYKKGGILELKDAVSKTLDIKIDRYLKLNNETFTLLCDVLGGVNINVPSGLRGLNEGTQNLSSEFIIKFLSNKKFSEPDRTEATGNLVSEMLIQTTGNRVASALDYTFEKLVNSSTETDITAIDYNDQKKALEYMLTNNQFEATYINPSTEAENNGIKLTSTSKKEIKELCGIK